MFTEFPQCGLSYSLTNSKTFINLDSSQNKITVFTKLGSDKGVYKTKLKVDPLTQGLNKEFEF
jgi:outer membrane protein W